MRNVNKTSPAFLYISFAPPPDCLTLHSHLFTVFSCQAEGCDGVLGSSAVIDKCGVCGGQDNSCRKVSGSFQNVTVPLGYHKILDIPPGARLINITEKQASPNYLGEMLKDKRAHTSGAQDFLNKSGYSSSKSEMLAREVPIWPTMVCVLALTKTVDFVALLSQARKS